MVWLFGEMEVNQNEDPDKFYKRACKVAEVCGYLVTKTNKNHEPRSEHIEIFGEDFNDNYILVNIVNIFDNKISSLQKIIYSDDYTHDSNNTLVIKRKMHKIYTYKPKLDTWEISFNADQFRKDHGQDKFIEVIQ